MTSKRTPTANEMFVLGLVQEIHGSQNTAADIFFTDEGEACISARDENDVARVFVNLTNLGDWYHAGQVTLEDLRSWISAEHAA